MTDSDNLPSGPKPSERDTTFMEDPMMDHLLRALVTVTMELSVSRERIETLEALLAKSSVLAAGSADEYQPAGEEASQRAARRAKLIDDVLGPMVSRLSRLD